MRLKLWMLKNIKLSYQNILIKMHEKNFLLKFFARHICFLFCVKTAEKTYPKEVRLKT